jgi:hypothetical protein
MPLHHGFDYSGLISTMGNAPACLPYTNAQTPYVCYFARGGQVTQQPWRTENLPQRFVREFQRFLTQGAGSNQPFFWYHSFLHVHTPLFVSDPRWLGSSSNGLFGDMVQEMDDEVGQLMNIIRGIPNTVVFWVSDNGPWFEDFVYAGPDAGETSAGPFKGGKGMTWEGGFRVPAIAWFPGKIPANFVNDDIVSTMDIYPTVSRWGLVPLPHDRIIDGKDISDLLLQNRGGMHTNPWQNTIYPYFCGQTLFAARWHQFKAHWITPDFVNYTGAATPSNVCHGECCPFAIDDPYRVGLCGCNNFNPLTGQVTKRITVQNPPLLYDLRKDIHEDRPLTPANFDDYWEVMNVINAQADALKATIPTGIPNQLQTPIFNNALQPCCGTVCTDLGIVVPCRCDFEGI